MEVKEQKEVTACPDDFGREGNAETGLLGLMAGPCGRNSSGGPTLQSSLKLSALQTCFMHGKSHLLGFFMKDKGICVLREGVCTCFLDGPWSGLGVTSRPNLSVVEVRNSLGGVCVDFHRE